MSEKTTSSPLDALLNEGYEFARAGKLFDAIKCFEYVVEQDPELADGWFFLGAAREKLGDNPPGIMARGDFYRDASSAFQRTTELEPNVARGWLHWGYCLEKWADYTSPYEKDKISNLYNQAIAAYQRKIELDPGDPDGWYDAANVYRKLDKIDEAIKHYQKALDLNPDDDDAREWLYKLT